MMDAFTEDEKRFVLAEYIKASQVDTEQLVEFIKAYNLQADWFSMQLPGGRNMHQCMRAASNLLDIDLQFPSLPNLEPRKRKSAGDLNEHAPKRVASMTPIQYQPRPASQSQVQPPPQLQPQPQLPPTNPNASRAIQPRPSADATAEGYSVFQSQSPSNGYVVFQSNPTGRKRGRPSKAEKEAQARASSYATNTPVPISPKPAIPPAAGAVATGYATMGASHPPTVNRAAPVSTGLRHVKQGGRSDAAAGETTHGPPRNHHVEQSSSGRSEKSPDPARAPILPRPHDNKWKFADTLLSATTSPSQ